MRGCLRYSIFFSLISALIIVIFSPYVSNTVLKNSIPIYLLYLLALSLPFCSISSCLNGYFMALQKIFVIVVCQILEIAIPIVTVIIFYKFNLFNNTTNICLALILGLVISNVISSSYLGYKYLLDYKKIYSHNEKSFIKQICKISLPVAFTTYIKSGLSTLKHSLIPIALMGYGFSYNDSLSYYGIISGTVMSLILSPFTLIQSYCNLLIPEISTYDKTTSMKKVTYIAKKSIFMTFVFSLMTVITLILFSHWIDTNLYKSLDIEMYIKLLAPIIIYIYMDNVIDSLLKSLDLQTYVVVINIIDLITTILCINFLIPKFGVSAYIFILYFSEMFNFSLSLYILRKRLNKK